MTTAALLDALNGREDAPWGDLKGKMLESRNLARMLARYEVKPSKLRIGMATAHGYRRADFYDAWQRYLTALPHVPDVPLPMGENYSAEKKQDLADAAVNRDVAGVCEPMVQLCSSERVYAA